MIIAIIYLQGSLVHCQPMQQHDDGDSPIHALYTPQHVCPVDSLLVEFQSHICGYQFHFYTRKPTYFGLATQ